jgi:hypothetical protein
MKQVQLRNINKESDNYNKIVCKGLMSDNGNQLYLLDSVEKLNLFDMAIKDLNSRFVDLEGTNDLTDIELGFLDEFANCVTTLKYYNRKKDYFENEGKRLASNEDNLTLLDLLECYKELDACKEDYIQGLTRIDEINKQLEELQKSFSNYLSNTKEDSDIDLLELILTNTPTYLDKDQLKLSVSGHAPLVDLTKVLAYNGELFNTESLFGLVVDIKGITTDVDFTLTFTYNLLEPLTYAVATKVIKEFKATSEFLIALNKCSSEQAEIDEVTE